MGIYGKATLKISEENALKGLRDPECGCIFEPFDLIKETIK